MTVWESHLQHWYFAWNGKNRFSLCEKVRRERAWKYTLYQFCWHQCNWSTTQYSQSNMERVIHIVRRAAVVNWSLCSGTSKYEHLDILASRRANVLPRDMSTLTDADLVLMGKHDSRYEPIELQARSWNQLCSYAQYLEVPLVPFVSTVEPRDTRYSACWNIYVCICMYIMNGCSIDYFNELFSVNRSSFSPEKLGNVNQMKTLSKVIFKYRNLANKSIWVNR